MDRKKSQPAGSVETQSHEWATISSEFNQFRSIPSAPSMTAGQGGLSKIEYQSMQQQTISEESYLINNNSNEEESSITCKERLKRWLSNEVNWKTMRERNIIFNCSEEDSNENGLEQSLLYPVEYNKKKKSKKIKQQQQQQQQFRSNAIQTSKYTIINFFFINLYEQFTKLANIYFLAMGLFQMIPAISSSEGIPYVYLPLSFIIVVTAIKDIIEDIKRHRSDTKENNYPAERYFKNQFKKIRSAEIQVGDIIKVSQNHQIPADIVLLFSSTQIAGNSNQARQKGVCYLETKNLDGETALKTKIVNKGVQQLIKSEESLADFEGTLKSEAPNPFLYKYSGSLRLFRKDKTDENFLRVNCEEENFLLRGSILKNTEFIIGVVTFTGHESKIMLNSNRPRPKKSKVELDMNKEIILIWLSQAIFCLISASFGLLWFIINKDSLSYLELENDGISQSNFGYFWVRYGNWLLIFMNFVPISLLITLDVIRICQALIIMKSKKMMSFHLIDQNDDVDGLTKEDIISQREKDNFLASDKQPIKRKEDKELDSQKKPSQDQMYMKIHPIVQASNLNEDLGQIKCVFSDKTGTLTCNVMNLKAVIFKGRIYGELQTEQMSSPNESQKDLESFQERLQNQSQSKSKSEEQDSNKPKNVNFKDIEFTEMVQNNSDPDLQKFLNHLAICHTVLHSENQSGGCYQATSPDELALVSFSKFFGVEFKGRTENETINITTRNSVDADNLFEFQMLHILHFSSERKRMSVIVKDQLGRIMLLTKGADQVILPRITQIPLNYQEPANQNINIKLEQISQNLSTLSKNGLRTLVMTHKILELDYYMEWKRRYEDAQNLLGGNKENEMNSLMDEIEQDLEFLGATGIEDKLQSDVQDTIVALKNAGVTVWILTGDKRETAINVALCSKIVQSEKIIEIYATEISQLAEQLRQISIENKRVIETVTAYQQQIPEDLINEDAFMSSVSSDENIADRIQAMSILSNQQRQRDQMQFNNEGPSIKYSNDSCSIMDQNSLEFYLSSQAYSLVIEGYSLELLMNSDQQTQQLFQEAIKKASSIVACRVSPKQKQLLVSMYKRFFPKHRTLAIGDGANDVNMLTEAHVGVGIQGLEGLQAARASDFSIGEFKLLKRLMLVHGRECYRRNSTVILFNFYKNIVYLVPVFWFGVYSGFSGTFIYDQLLYQCFNTFFTSVPIVFFAILDKDLSSKVLMTVPYFYRLGVQNRYFNTSMLWQWFFNAVFQAFVIGTICIFVLQSPTIDGHEPGVNSMGQIMFGISIIVVNVKVLIFSNVQYLITIILCILSTLLYMGMAAFFNIIHTNVLYLEFSKLIEQPTAWLALLLILGLTSLFDVGHRTYMKIGNLQQIKHALSLNEDQYSILVESTIEQQNKK